MEARRSTRDRPGPVLGEPTPPSRRLPSRARRRAHRLDASRGKDDGGSLRVAATTALTRRPRRRPAKPGNTWGREPVPSQGRPRRGPTTDPRSRARAVVVRVAAGRLLRGPEIQAAAVVARRAGWAAAAEVVRAVGLVSPAARHRARHRHPGRKGSNRSPSSDRARGARRRAATARYQGVGTARGRWEAVALASGAVSRPAGGCGIPGMSKPARRRSSARSRATSGEPRVSGRGFARYATTPRCSSWTSFASCA